MRCEYCKYWVYADKEDPVFNHGDCHRFPKAEQTYDYYWCGEFEPKEYCEPIPARSS